jgi:site-specific DNA-cytosine methylase
MLSVDEAKRAMSFPASYRLTGNRAEQMKQLGNAVCPAMAQGIAEQMEAA